MDPYLFKRLLRRPWLTLCTIVVSILLCVLMGYLMNYRQTQTEKLEEAQQSFDIFCEISDSKGTKTDNLRTSQYILDFLCGEDAPMAPYVRDMLLTKEFEFRSPKSGIPEWNEEYFGAPLTGMNSEKCWDWINPEMGGTAATFFVEDFFASEEFICLVSEGIYAQLESDTIVMDVEDLAVGTRKDSDYGKAEVEFTVAGTYPGMVQTVVIPFAASQKLALLTSRKGSVDSISFYVSDNRLLDEMAEVAAQKFEPVDPLSVSGRFSLVIRDEQYRATTAVLEQNIRRTTLLLPIVMLLGLGVGFLVSFLATRNERKTYALMRTLGMTAKTLFASVLREQLVPVMTGAAIGFAVSRELLPTVIYLLCYGVGCTVCIFKSIQVPPTAILREQE